MGVLVLTMANVAAAYGGAWSLGGGTASDWALVFLALIGIATLIAFVAAFKRRFPEPGDRNREFAKTLTKAVKHHTEQLEREFRTALRVPGLDSESGRSDLGATAAIAHIRNLRRLLRPSMAFIRHARSLPIGEWPSYDLSHAFANWAGLIDATDQLLSDMFREVTAASATGHWHELRTQYEREEISMFDDLRHIPALTSAVDKAAKPFLKKSGKHEESDEAHH